MRQFILADNQDITRAGWLYLLNPSGYICHEVSDKKELMSALETYNDALVVLDFALFDIGSVSDLIHMHDKYPETDWIVCSDDFSDDLIRQLIYNAQSFSLLLKNSPIEEFQSCIKQTIKRNRYISSYVSNLLFEMTRSQGTQKKEVLTQTEKEILKDIALGKSTKEIASLRNISVHTVMTHRKNIFRKIEVNNVHEATKYAMRAGIVDMTEYYI